MTFSHYLADSATIFNPNLEPPNFFLTLCCFSCQGQLLVQVSCQYHQCFQSYDNFYFMRDLPEIQKLEIPLSEFRPISGDWRVRNTKLTRTSLIKCQSMLQNIRVTAFTVSELLRENHQDLAYFFYKKHTTNTTEKLFLAKFVSFHIINISFSPSY